jgi:hypothetical protein
MIGKQRIACLSVHIFLVWTVLSKWGLVLSLWDVPESFLRDMKSIVDRLIKIALPLYHGMSMTNARAGQ